MPILQQSAVQVNFADDTYAVIDPTAGAISLHQGQRTGADDDWGGQVVAWLELDKALAIFEAVQNLSQVGDAEMRTRFWGGGPALTFDAGWDAFRSFALPGIVIRSNEAMAGWKAARADAREMDVERD